jgi:hypothetical protein
LVFCTTGTAVAFFVMLIAWLADGTTPKTPRQRLSLSYGAAGNA